MAPLRLQICAKRCGHDFKCRNAQKSEAGTQRDAIGSSYILWKSKN